MSIIQGRANIGQDGRLIVDLPEGFSGHEVEFTLDIHAPAAKGNGRAGTTSPYRRTREQWRAFVASLSGRIDDSTFVRPPQGEYENRESLGESVD